MAAFLPKKGNYEMLWNQLVAMFGQAFAPFAILMALIFLFGSWFALFAIMGWIKAIWRHAFVLASHPLKVAIEAAEAQVQQLKHDRRHPDHRQRLVEAKKGLELLYRNDIPALEQARTKLGGHDGLLADAYSYLDSRIEAYRG